MDEDKPKIKIKEEPKDDPSNNDSSELQTAHSSPNESKNHSENISKKEESDQKLGVESEKSEPIRSLDAESSVVRENSENSAISYNSTKEHGNRADNNEFGVETNSESRGEKRRNSEGELSTEPKKWRRDQDNLQEMANETPISNPSSTNETTTTIERIEEMDEDSFLYGESVAADVREYPTPADTLESENLPSNVEQFINVIFEWDPSIFKKPVDKDIKPQLERKLKDMSSIYSYPSDEIYKVVNIPLVLMNLYEDIKSTSKQLQSQKEKNELITCSIVLKCETNMKTLEIKCISLRECYKNRRLSFGQLVELRSVFQRKPDDPNSLTYSLKSYFGYIIQIRTRETSKESRSEINHLNSLNGDSLEYLVDEIIIRTKFTNDLFVRNDYIFIMQPFKCVHYYTLQAKALFKLNSLPICQQLLNPKLNVKASGLFIDVDGSKYSDSQLDAIQKSVDIVANLTQNPNFACLKSSDSNVTDEIVVETIRQLLNFMQRKQLPRGKIIVTAPSHEQISRLLDKIKNVAFKIFYFGKAEKQVRRECKKQAEYNRETIKKKLDNESEANKEILKKKLQEAERIFQYFDVDTQQLEAIHLIPSERLEVDTMLEKANRILIEKSDIIAGKIEDICNDVQFYRTFNVRNCSRVICCFIDNANAFTEPDISSLYYFGIDRFIMCDTEINDVEDNSLLSKYRLNRSLYSRLFHNEFNRAQPYSSIIDLDSNIL